MMEELKSDPRNIKEEGEPSDKNTPDEDEFLSEVDGNYETKFNVDKVYFGFLIGKKGATKKKLEHETETKINFPKMGTDGDIIITGRHKSNLASARTQMNLIVKSAKHKVPITHFISIPFNYILFKNSFLKFKEEVLETCPNDSIDEKLFQSEDKLHLTMGIFLLSDDKEKQFAASLLPKCKEQVIDPLLVNSKLRVNMTGVDCMEKDPSKVKVLFAKITSCHDPDLLQNIANGIISFYSQAGLIKEEKCKVHVTLMNTSFLKHTEKRRWFDAREILQKFKDFEFGEMDVDRIDLSIRFTSSESGYYKSLATIEI